MASCATTGGTCTKKPTTVPTGGPTNPIVCGCDNITYWNEQLAATFGVSVKTSGAACPNTTAVKCNDTITRCPDGRFCNRFVGNNGAYCSAVLEGTCWGIPDTCPEVSGGRSHVCGSGSCKSACEAIRGQHAWYTDATCN